MVADQSPALSRIRWRGAFRIVRSVYPPINLFEDIADPDDWELIVSGEAKTNPRIRQDIGDISLVPRERRVAGAGTSPVMAPFTHVSRERPTRFSDGRCGIYYAGDRFEVALKETIHHYECFMRATDEPASEEDFREYVGAVDHRFHDLRNDRKFADCLDPESYSASQNLGAA